MSVNSRAKAIKIIVQGKTLHGHKILESSCATKETFDIGILVTSSNDGRKIFQSIRKTSKTVSRIREWSLLNQFR